MNINKAFSNHICRITDKPIEACREKQCPSRIPCFYGSSMSMSSLLSKDAVKQAVSKFDKAYPFMVDYAALELQVASSGLVMKDS